MESIKDLNYYKNNCEEDYINTPISVLRYISELEQALQLKEASVRNSVICDDWIHEERVKQNDDTYCPICSKQLQSK